MNQLLIYGAGTSGTAAAHLACHLGMRTWLYDDHRPPHQVPAELRDKFIVDLQHLKSLVGAHPTTLMPSPGTTETSSTYRQLAQTCRAGLLSEIDFGLNHLQAPILAITGTNGKSTCCAMIQHLFKGAQVNLPLMGNFGIPVTQRALEAATTQPSLGYILELSSYQLAQSQQLTFPVAIITNINADHLDRHLSMSAYVATKWRLAPQAPEDTTHLITPPHVLEQIHHHELPVRGDQIIQTRAGPSATVQTPMDLELKQLASWGCRCFARHLRQYHKGRLSVEANHGLKRLADLAIAELTQQLEDFPGLPHRLERLGLTPQGEPAVTYINDAKSTNLSATAYAIATLAPEQPSTLLILGGLPKSAPVGSPAPELVIPPWIRWMVIIGSHAQDIQATLVHSANTNLSTVPTLSHLLQPAEAFLRQLRERNISCVLFSPSGSSLDQYPHYEARGGEFKRLVQALHPRHH